VGPKQRPIALYQLLGISPDESDPKVIEEAALRKSIDVRAYQLTREPECTRLLSRIATALDTLLDPVRRAEYDHGFGKPLYPRASLAERRTRKGTRACDVKLIVCSQITKGE
jgi:curved DNA-binding protein CbpA